MNRSAALMVYPLSQHKMCVSKPLSTIIVDQDYILL